MHHARILARSGNYLASSTSPKWIGNAVAEHLGLDPEDDGDRTKVKEIVKRWFKNGVFATEEREDESRHKRQFVVPGNWNEAETEAATV